MKNNYKEQCAVIFNNVDEIIPKDELENKIKKSIKTNIPLNVKLGCDPSRPDLHVGHSVVLNKLKDFQGLSQDLINMLIKNSGTDRKILSLEIEKIKGLFLKKIIHP